MAVLDTFYLLFKSDTSNLKKGADEAQRIIGGLSKVLAAAIPAAFGIEGIRKAIDFGVELSQTSRKLGVNAQDLQAWSNAAELAGGTAAQFQGTLSSLANRFGTSSETILKVLPRYADVLSRLSPSRAQQIGKNLGLDESTILLLQRGRRELESVIKKQKEIGEITKIDTEQYLKYNRALTETKQTTQGFFTLLANESIPVLTKFYEYTSKAFSYLLHHKDLITGAFIAIAGGASLLAAPFIAANAPVIALTGLVLALGAAFVAVFEDIKKFREGAPSITGLVKDQIDATGKKIESFGDSLPKSIQFLTGYKALSADNNFQKAQPGDLAKGIKDFFSGIKLDGSFLNKLSGHNALASTTEINNHIANVTINTQATDGVSIYNELLGEINKQTSQVVNFHGDGVRA